MTPRRKARILAMQMLYRVDIGKFDYREVLEDFFRTSSYDGAIVEFARVLFEGTIAHIDGIDSRIGEHASNWTIERMASVDRNILRMATFEVLFLDNISVNVTINEAIEIAKVYSTEESSRFINGILDEIAKRAHLPHKVKK
jgi:N utilization substance protein B